MNKTPELKQPTILLVDDEHDVLFILGKQLVAAGFNILSTDKGEDAIRLAQTNEPDLIILDMLMPHQSGNEIGAILKGDPQTREIPIIFLTAMLSKEDEEAYGHRLGDQTVFAKPYEIEALVEAIEKKVRREKCLI